MLRSLGSMIETALAAGFKASRSLDTVLRNSLPLHKKVMEAISEGDGDTARDTMQILLNEARDGVIGLFTEGGD